MLMTHEIRTMMRWGKPRDEINETLRTTIMPDMVRFQRDAMRTFNAMLNDPFAPNHSMQ
jgi:hypothetical protein